MGKKKQQGGFYFFMMEKKKDVERRLGRVVSMQELPELLGAEWQNLSGEEKKRYSEMGKKNRESAEKLDSRGVPLSEIRRRVEEERQKTKDMKREIEKNIDFHKTGGALHHLTIYVIGTSHYVHTDEETYSPAELSIAQFNFDKGIMRDYNMIFKPDIPLGYAFLAQEHSDATHNLLDDENTDGVVPCDAAVDILQFVTKENDKVPPLYTLEEQMEATTALLDTIVGEDYFKVYSLDHFFMNMYNAAVSSPQIPLSIATDMLTQCGFDFHIALPCEWHKTYKVNAIRFCTLSCIRRWMYLMCDNMLLSETFGIVPQEGKHLPRAVPAFGILVDLPSPIFTDDRNPASQDDKKGRGGSSFSSKSKSVDGSAIPSSLTNRFDAVEKEPYKPLRRPALSPSSTQGATSLPISGPSRASSMASICSNRIDATSEEDFPALGAGVARRAPLGDSSTSLGSVGRGVIGNQTRQNNGRERSNNQPGRRGGRGRGLLRSWDPVD